MKAGQARRAGCTQTLTDLQEGVVFQGMVYLMTATCKEICKLCVLVIKYMLLLRDFRSDNCQRDVLPKDICSRLALCRYLDINTGWTLLLFSR